MLPCQSFLILAWTCLKTTFNFSFKKKRSKRNRLFACLVRAVFGVFELGREFPGFSSHFPFGYAEYIPAPCMGAPVNCGNKVKIESLFIFISAIFAFGFWISMDIWALIFGFLECGDRYIFFG